MKSFKAILISAVALTTGLTLLFYFKQEKLYLQVDCAIYTLEGTLEKKFSDYLCLFMDDGSRYSLKASTVDKTGYVQGKITRYSKTNQIVWQKNLDVHHELSLTPDKQHLTFISSESGEADGRKIRFDVMNVSDLNGNIIKRWSTKDHFSEIKKEMAHWKRELLYLDIKTSIPFPDHYEFTHINSFKEIPPNESYGQLPWFQPGNYIIGVNCLNLFFILDQDLNKIIKTISYGNYDQACGTHDAQVLSNGNILHYVNVKHLNEKKSYLQEYDPRSREVVWSWPDDKNLNFFNPMLGSVQRLKNGHTVFTDKVSLESSSRWIRGKNPSIIEIDKDGEIVRKWNLELLGFNELYRARILPLGRYLENTF